MNEAPINRQARRRLGRPSLAADPSTAPVPVAKLEIDTDRGEYICPHCGALRLRVYKTGPAGETSGLRQRYLRCDKCGSKVTWRSP